MKMKIINMLVVSIGLFLSSTAVTYANDNAMDTGAIQVKANCKPSEIYVPGLGCIDLSDPSYRP